MSHGILIQEKVAALNIDAYQRPAVSASAIDNGNIFNLLTKSSTSGESEVWVATAPATSALSNLWMAYEPEINVTVDGTKEYKGLNPDPRDFYMPIGKIFTAFKLSIGDLLMLTADNLDSATPQAYAVAVDGSFKFAWAAAAISGVSLKYLATSYISIGGATLGDTQRATSFKFEVVALA